MNPTRAKVALAAALAMVGGGVSIPGPTRKPYKPCLQCGTLHRHNNAWCSPACCKTWRGEQKRVIQ